MQASNTQDGPSLIHSLTPEAQLSVSRIVTGTYSVPVPQPMNTLLVPMMRSQQIIFPIYFFFSSKCSMEDMSRRRDGIDCDEPCFMLALVGQEIIDEIVDESHAWEDTS